MAYQEKHFIFPVPQGIISLSIRQIIFAVPNTQLCRTLCLAMCLDL